MFVPKRFCVNFLSSHVASRDWMTDVKVAEDGFDPASCLDIAKQLVSIYLVGNHILSYPTSGKGKFRKEAGRGVWWWSADVFTSLAPRS